MLCSTHFCRIVVAIVIFGRAAANEIFRMAGHWRNFTQNGRNILLTAAEKKTFSKATKIIFKIFKWGPISKFLKQTYSVPNQTNIRLVVHFYKTIYFTVCVCTVV